MQKSGLSNKKNIVTVLYVALMIVFSFVLVSCGGSSEEETVEATTEKPVDYESLGEYGIKGAHSEEVSFGQSDFRIHGTFSVPIKELDDGKKFPAVVLVGGSGPTDRDETIGANKIFKDIAEGLIDSGIAVLRYDKRTLTYINMMADKPEYYKKLTIDDEVVDDAVYAINYLRENSRIDPNRIFVLGHSLGGHMVPEIVNQAESGSVAGVILMAANVTPIWELMVTQTEYIAGLDGVITEQEEKSIQQLVEVRDYISSDNFNRKSDYRKCLQIYPPYWLSLKEYDALETAQNLDDDIRILVMQGARDYQVSTKDYEQWQEALGQSANYVLYDDLNHLFISGTGPSTPAEYMIPKKVSWDVIDDIALFVNYHD